jgi:hypothetical protein
MILQLVLWYGACLKKTWNGSAIRFPNLVQRCESGFDRKNFIRKLVRDSPVKRNSYAAFVRWLEGYKLRSRASRGR